VDASNDVVFAVLQEYSSYCLGIDPGEWVLPYMGYIGICSPKVYGFSTVLVINRVSILAISVVNRVLGFSHSGLELGVVFLEKATFSSLSIRSSTKALHNLCLGQGLHATTVINRVSNVWSGH